MYVKYKMNLDTELYLSELQMSIINKLPKRNSNTKVMPQCGHNNYPETC